MKKLLSENPKFAEMDNESVAAINTLIGVNIPLNKEGSVTNMCKAWEDQKEEGRRELIRSMLSSGKTPEEISAFANLSLEEVQALYMENTEQSN